MMTGLVVALAPTFIDLHGRSGTWISSELPIRLNADRVNALDRTVIGNRSKLADQTSDLLLATSLIAPLLAGLGETALGPGTADDWKNLGTDALLLAKTLALTATVCNLVKFMVRRPRPYTYGLEADDQLTMGTEARLSFFSGHTSWAFSAATAYSYIFAARHPSSPWKVPVWIATHAVASATGVLRVLAGKHYWSDVLVGAAVGSAIGFAVPHLFFSSQRRKGSLWADLRLVPSFYEGGFGVNAVLWW